jgi:molybdate transport system substrate-binding protein
MSSVARSVLLACAFAFTAVAAAETLVIAAASSLQDAIEEIADAWQRAHPPHRVTLTTASSATLLAQIRHGAAVDVFASASAALIADATAEGWIAGEPVTFATNTLAVVIRSGAGIATLADLAKPGLRIALAADGVPAGVYARAWLADLAHHYGATYPHAVAANVVTEEPNVRQAALRVAWGDVDAAIVYATDAERLGLRTLTPPAAPPVIALPAAALRSARAPALAASFLTFLTGPEAKAILQRHAFTLP